MNFKSVYVSGLLAVWPVMQGMAQSELIKFGDFDQWIVRNIKERHYRWRYQTVVRNRSGRGLEREQGLYESGRFAVGNVECDGQGLRNHQDEYFGLPGEAGRRLLCPPGDSCRESESHGNCEYRSVGSRFTVLFFWAACPNRLPIRPIR
mgnify:CR=1 FL=1